MRIIRFTLFFFICFLIKSFAQQQVTLEFENINQADKLELDRLIQPKIQNKIDSLVSTVREIILNNYFSKGFLNSEIIIQEKEDTLSKKNILQIKIEKGKKHIISSIIINDTLTLTDADKDKINNFDIQVLNDYNVKIISDDILKYSETNGYIFAEVNFDGIEKIDEDNDNKYYKLFFTIIPNKKAVITDIQIEGNEDTDDDVIIRSARIKTGDIYDTKLSDEIVKRLNKMKIFSTINQPEFFLNQKDEGILKISVVEGNTNNFDGIIGYNPAEGNQDGYLNGLVNVSLRNIFGTYRAFSLRWQKIDRLSQDLELKYFEPWIFRLPLHLAPEFLQHQQDTTYIQRVFSFAAEVLLSDELSGLLIFSTERIIPNSETNLNKLNNSSSYNLGFGIKYDTRDDILLAQEGLFFRSEYIFKNKKVFNFPDNNNFTFQKITASFDFYHLLFKRFVIYVGLQVKQIEGDHLEVSDLFKFGGLNSLRGFSENQFIGSKLGFTNLETRLILSKNNVVYIFLDLGYYYNNMNNEEVSNFKYGYGVGLYLDSPLGIMKISYGLGENKSFSKGKIHFGIINVF